ncbi:MAG TPA: bifunctional lysylphosphatidylglycerol flippase/synthetase MprF [Myxococcota bacterium]|nr:bifunctional lysylphosphatidylglycerol flippase/synthetase MprF [Myxococcota bacterium]
MKERLLAAIAPIVGLALFAATIAILHRELAAYHMADVIGRLLAIPARQLAAALGFTFAGYVALTGYDLLAFRWIGRQLALRRIALASFIAYVFSHNVGLSFLGGSAVRYRMYSSWGVPPAELGRAIAFNFVTLWLGFFALGALLLLADPVALPGPWHGIATTRPLGAVFALLTAAYWIFFVGRRRDLDVGELSIEIPGPRISAAQTVLSAVDWTLAAAAFYVLLPHGTELGFARFMGIFLIAQVAGLVSHVPAGLGVFETAMVMLLAPWHTPDVVLGTALAYRCVYYLIPFVLAIALFAGFEMLQRRRVFARAGSLIGQWLPEIVPRFFSVATLAAGALLLVSGSTPAMPARIALLHLMLPEPVVEVSHFLGSVIGVGLLLLARAVQQRVDAGYALTLALLFGGAGFSLLKGLDWEEALVLLVMGLALAPCRRFFYRRSSLFAQSFTPAWTMGIAGILLGTLYVVLLANRHVEYSNQLWWEFEFTGDAPRSLRALAGGSLLLSAFALARLLRPARPPATPPEPVALEPIAKIVDASTAACAHLALLGDKRVLLHESGTGFVMYGVQRRSWISMGDPVGPPDVRRELAWRFFELADQHGGLVAFYQVRPDDLPVYLDLGLDLRKLGESARVQLTDFSLSGGRRKGLRATYNRLQRVGLTLDVVPPSAVPPLIPRLREISDEWLGDKNTREKRFSLGSFAADYLARTPIAIVRHEDHIVAFANLWAPDPRNELSVDLMRYSTDAPSGVMDFLFIEILQWGRTQGYRWCDLGMAPLAGLERHRLAPLWSRVGAIVFAHGEQFYNFQGLRSFKDKFDPVWEPRYLAAPGGFALAGVLTDVAALISGGVTGIVSK